MSKLFLVIAAAGLAPLLMNSSLAAGPAPLRADVTCAVPAQSRALRIQYLKEKISEAEKNLAIAQTGFDTVHKTFLYMNHSYRVASVFGFITSIAPSIATLQSLIASGLAQTVAKTGALTLAGSTIGSYFDIGYNWDKLTRPGYTVKERDIDGSVQERLDLLKNEELSEEIAANLNERKLLTSPVCGHQECAAEDPIINDAFGKLLTWYDKNSDAAAKKHDYDRAGNYEYNNNDYGYSIGDVELPFARAALGLFRYRLEHYQAIAKILENDAQACAR